jgi:hypothetical protein
MPSIKPIKCPRCGIQNWPGDKGLNCGKLSTGETIITCECGEKFILTNPRDYKILSSNYFVRLEEASNHSEKGVVELLPGRAIEVKFKKSFDYPCKAIITPTGPVYVTDYYLRNDCMTILSSFQKEDLELNKPITISWLVYGLADIKNIPTWYILFYAAMTDNARWLYKAALLNYAASFEAFLESYLHVNLTHIYGPSKSEYILRKHWRIEERCKDLLSSVTKHKLSEDNEIYQPWYKNVKEKRDRLMHGENISILQDDAEDAHRANYQAIRWIQNLALIK